MTPFYKRFHRMFASFIRKLYRIEIIGAENEPKDGSVIVCVNHLSNSDVIIVAASLKRQVRYVAKAELFKIPLLGRLIRALGAFPIERGRGDVAAIKKTISILKEGEMVGFYPQGHRYPGKNPVDTEVKSGIGLIAARSKAAILPVCIETKKFKVRMFRKTRVIIGKPISYDTLPFSENNRSDYERVSKYIFFHICNLLPEQYKTALPATFDVSESEPSDGLSGDVPIEETSDANITSAGSEEKNQSGLNLNENDS